ncbi:uncharacterized protein C4orf54 homolog [Centropristis striata]|uniref:uncharacterized protein C4orf54 homolog n=1 Tax=Centropristis striata TaxID=184440 RepID=UPI0027DF3B58|nr:uncharacterized protein C4orf54 homolog [Centropristis striata]
MEAAEETLTYRDDTLLHRKLLPEDKHKDNTDSKRLATETRSEESNYVDLDMKPDGAKTVKVTFTGEGNQLSVIKCDSSKQGEHDEEGKIISEDFVEEQLEDERATVPGPVSGEPPLETLSKLPNTDQDSENEKQRQAELDPSDCSEHDELQYTDMYLNSKTESDDGASAVLSDHCGSDTVEDESHYITTHEIQLTELDHDVDYDLGRGTSWDFEDDNLVYSFVDYASFESDDTQEGTLILEGRSQAKVQAKLGAVVSTEQEDSDLCDSDKCASSDESLCKNHSGDANAGKIHLSIKTSSRAVNEPVSIFDNNTCGYTKHFGDGSHFSFVSSGARVGPLCDRAQYFIPAPGRQHLASKLRRKDINEYSSGASSSISELDDADKEVRNLTAKSFRSLACPYFDAINLSTSSESSVSEYGLNNWSAYVDWNYGNIRGRGRERSVIAHKTSRATLEMNKTVDSKRHGKSSTGTKGPQTKTYALNKRTSSQQSSSSSKNIELRDPVHPKQRGVTLNFRCNVEAPEGARRPICSKKAASNEVTGTVLARSGCKMQYHHTDGVEVTHKRAVFASSLLKNVISKKMQFEQERKMERGEISDTYPAISPSFQLKDQDRGQGRGMQRQTSESGSGYTVSSADDPHREDSRPCSCEPAEEQNSNAAPEDAEKVQQEPLKASLSHSQSSAFNSVKEDEPESVHEAESTSVTDTQTTAKGLDTSSMLTKLLFVPSCQLISKEKDFTEDLSNRAPDTDAQKCEKEFKTGNDGNIVGKEENEKAGKSPEIKICLRSVKENKGCTLNIASLLTPKISFNTVNTNRAAGEAKCHVLSASNKPPNFTVRDIRDTKCKFQTPIYQVRDVRKLVKSSYRFVSLENSESKCSSAADKYEVIKEPVKHVSPSPIVIKCHSVKTNAKQTQADACETSQNENTPSHCTASRVPLVVSKQPEQSETQTNIETKLTKQRQEKSETAERRNEPKIPKQAALEKLKAAVKTMEQLYVFDRNEWKRKTQAPQPITDSHVLSLIASEEHGAEELEATNTDRIHQSQDDKGALNIIHVPYSDDTFQTQSQQSKTFSNKSVLHFGNKANVSISSVIPQSSALQTSSTMKSSPAAPLSVKIEPSKHGQVERGKVKIIPTNPTVAQACSDSENYLTIPGLGYMNEVKLLNREPVSREGSSNQIQPDDRKTPEQKRSPLIMEYPASSIYHQGPQAQQQVLCFSPTVPTVSPTLFTGEAVPQTQRKMLLDPTTGHYYLVDTPIQATTKRLFDPETGQYVEVPMSHSPVSPVTPVNPVPPVPVSLSPLALSPGTYAPTYMIYPGFIPSPTLPAQAVLSQSPCHSEDAGGEKVKHARSPKPEATGAESAYYSATREATQGPLQLPVSVGHVTTRGGAASTDRKPVISITTPQGPRIIAPPSFDGTTMSFVVEHR